MDVKVYEIIKKINQEQEQMRKDIIFLENDVKKIRNEFWEGYIPLCVLIGTYALMCYNSSYSGVKHTIVPLDRPLNTVEFRR